MGGPFFGHSLVLYDGSLNVPLIVRPPQSAQIAPRRHAGTVSNAGVMTTLLTAAGVPLDEAEGLVAPLPLRAGPSEASATAFSVMRDLSGRSKYGELDWASIRSDGWRLIEKRQPKPQLELLRELPEGDETVDLSENPEMLEQLLSEIHARYPLSAPVDADSVEALSDKESELLRQLGYIE